MNITCICGIQTDYYTEKMTYLLESAVKENIGTYKVNYTVKTTFPQLLLLGDVTGGSMVNCTERTINQS